MKPSDSSPNADQNLVMYCPPPSHTFLRRTGQYTTLMVLAGIIAAILYPLFVSVPQHDNHGSCISNAKQIGTALLMYAQDYDERFPCGARANRQKNVVIEDSPPQAKYHVGQGWVGGLYPYLKNTQVFLCPVARRELRQAGRLVFKRTGPVS